MTNTVFAWVKMQKIDRIKYFNQNRKCHLTKNIFKDASLGTPSSGVNITNENCFQEV